MEIFYSYYFEGSHFIHGGWRLLLCGPFEINYFCILFFQNRAQWNSLKIAPMKIEYPQIKS